MRARFLQGHWKKVKKLLSLKREADQDGEYRVAKRIHGVVLNMEGRTSIEIAQVLKSPRSAVSLWLKNYEADGLEGILEGHRSGRPCVLNHEQLKSLEDIVESGPVAYGFLSGVWTSLMVARVIEEEFGVKYHPGHVRKILHQLDFSVQQPKRSLAKADPLKRSRWKRYTYPHIKKKPKKKEPALIYNDEASFRQDSTLHRTWAKSGCQPLIPVTGQRKSIKVFGSVELFSADFQYKTAEVFNAKTYLGYLEEMTRIYFPRKTFLVQENASYHKDKEVWQWFGENRNWLTVYNLPPYCPELNATERLWHHTRLTGTHNRYFTTLDELHETLMAVFDGIRLHPEQIRGYLQPFC